MFPRGNTEKPEDFDYLCKSYPKQRLALLRLISNLTPSSSSEHSDNSDDFSLNLDYPSSIYTAHKTTSWSVGIQIVSIYIYSESFVSIFSLNKIFSVIRKKGTQFTFLEQIITVHI
jgi:hypothetical protein